MCAGHLRGPHTPERHPRRRLEGLAQRGDGFAEVVPMVGVEFAEGGGFGEVGDGVGVDVHQGAAGGVGG